MGAAYISTDLFGGVGANVTVGDSHFPLTVKLLAVEGSL